MKKTTKIVSIFITTLFMLSSSIVFAQHQTQQQMLDEPDMVFFDEIDQSQMTAVEGKFIPVGQFPLPNVTINFQCAQSVIPTLGILTQVELYVGKNGTTTHPLTVAIRDNLTHSDLVAVDVPASQVPTEDFAWVVCDLPDYLVSPGTSFYIVCYTENTTDNWYVWGGNPDRTSYPYGCAWVSLNDGGSWTNDSTNEVCSSVETWCGIPPVHRTNESDMCFVTYGRGNVAPDIPEITGTLNGKAGNAYEYTFVTTDVDGDEVYYWVDWGDGCPAVEWNGPYPSGDPFILSHVFDSKGDYTIRCKAKDVFEEESDWGTLEISMPYAVGNTDSLLGWTFIRGLVGNLKKIGNDLYFRTIRLHYLEFTGMEISMGVLRLKRCRVNDLGYDRQLVIGPLGSLVWIVGFCHGGITEL